MGVRNRKREEKEEGEGEGGGGRRRQIFVDNCGVISRSECFNS